jgi:hypothetical protein
MEKAKLLDIGMQYKGVSRYVRPADLNAITEGRTQGNASYAWCGDFATFVLDKAGVRDGEALNRVSINGKWVPGDNLARLQRWAASHAAWSGVLKTAQPGDLLIMARPNGNHIGYVIQLNPLITLDGNGWNAEVHVTTRTPDEPVLGVIDTQQLLTAISTGYRWAPTEPSQPGYGADPVTHLPETPFYAREDPPLNTAQGKDLGKLIFAAQSSLLKGRYV